jgi:hypothetical protein
MDEQGKSEHRPYRTRTSVLFAAGAPKAVILRRGPRTHYHLIAWDLARDTFEHGQWMRGNVMLCDLSPRGDKLLYFAEQYVKPLARSLQGRYEPLKQQPVRKTPRKGRQHRRTPRYLRPPGTSSSSGAPRELKDGWTAISTPPYFSALAIWPSIGRWTGGGLFAAERDLVLMETEDGLTPIANVPVPTTWRIRAGRHPASYRMSAYAPSAGERAGHVRVATALYDAGLKWVDWMTCATPPTCCSPATAASSACAAGGRWTKARSSPPPSPSSTCATCPSSSCARPAKPCAGDPAPSRGSCYCCFLHLSIETELEDDGRWLADISQLLGVLAYGATAEEASAKVETLALRVLAEQFERSG